MMPAVGLELATNLKSLKLSTMARHLEEQVRQARAAGVDYAEFLASLTALEVDARRDHCLQRRLREAKFPLMKTLESFDYDAAPALDRRRIRELATGEYLADRRNIILVGKSGTGKTHVATGLGIEACRQGVRTRFVTACGLVNELLEANQERTAARVLAKYERYGLLIVDELGYIPLARSGAELLFQVLAQRHERASVIVTTNLGFGDWTQVFGDATLTAALLDRLTHKAQIIACTWDSYRLRETMRMKKS